MKRKGPALGDANVKRLKMTAEQHTAMMQDLQYDVSENEIFLMFNNLNINNSHPTHVLSQNKSLWQSKIIRYFPYLEVNHKKYFDEDPYSLFCE